MCEKTTTDTSGTCVGGHIVVMYHCVGGGGRRRNGVHAKTHFPIISQLVEPATTT